MRLEAILRVAAVVLLTFWWLPFAPFASLAFIADSAIASFAFWICSTVFITLTIPQLWNVLSRYKRHQQLLSATRWLVLVLPIVVAGVTASEHPTRLTALQPVWWFKLLVGGGALTLPASIAALVTAAPLFGVVAETKKLDVIAAAVLAYFMAAYCAVITTLLREGTLDSIDVVAIALMFAPSTAVFVGATAMAVVRRTTQAQAQ